LLDSGTSAAVVVAGASGREESMGMTSIVGGDA
jgi:hypothetical protein